MLGDISIDQIYLVLGLIVPGLIVTFVRAQFLTGRMPRHSEALLNYLVLSAVYLALALPLIEWLLSGKAPEGAVGRTAVWFGVTFLGPVLFGLLLGISAQREWPLRLAATIGLKQVHGVPTAWDFRFGWREEHWMLVTLKNGTRFAGYCGRRSLASSDPAERDLFIEYLYQWHDDGPWTPTDGHGLLIAAGEISTLEFYPVLR